MIVPQMTSRVLLTNKQLHPSDGLTKNRQQQINTTNLHKWRMASEIMLLNFVGIMNTPIIFPPRYCVRTQKY